jgi:hypothetical protein
MFCVVASGLFAARVPSACCQATIAFTFSVVTGIPRPVRKSCAHCSRLVVAAPAGVVAVVGDVDCSWSSRVEKSDVEVLLDAVPVLTGGAPKRDWISAMRASTPAMPSISTSSARAARF